MLFAQQEYWMADREALMENGSRVYVSSSQ